MRYHDLSYRSHYGLPPGETLTRITRLLVLSFAMFPQLTRAWVYPEHRDIAVLVEMAGVDPDDVGRRPVLGTTGAVEVELLLERGVRQERRHDHGPAVLRGELPQCCRGGIH